jgi:hypothetical protein
LYSGGGTVEFTQMFDFNHNDRVQRISRLDWRIR